MLETVIDEEFLWQPGVGSTFGSVPSVESLQQTMTHYEIEDLPLSKIDLPAPLDASFEILVLEE